MYSDAISKLVRKTSEIEIDGVKIAVKPTPRDAEMYLVAASNKQFDDKTVSRITEIMKNIVKRANPDISDEDLDALIAGHYGEFFTELSILFGFTTREQAEQMRKKIGEGGLAKDFQ